MKETIRFVKSMLGIYESGHEYWVYTKDIIVPTYYKSSPVGKRKWKHKLNYWLQTGEFESPILLNKNFVLVDGFSSAKIAYLKGIEKVPVYFVD